MGIFEWIKSRTGAWGPALLEFYVSNALWINTLVVLYGLLLVLSWKNLERIRDDLLEQILTQAREGLAHRLPGGKSRSFQFADFHPSWDQAMARSRFPWVARQNGFWPQRVSLETIRRLITEDELMRQSVSRLSALGLEIKQK